MDWFSKAIVIGDVHGEVVPLISAIRYAHAAGKPLILLGDYVNRGEHSRQVLSILLDEQRRDPEKILALRGNHERELLKFLDGGSLEEFAAHGGLATIRSYLSDAEFPGDPVAAFRDSFDPDHRLFLESMPTYIESTKYLFSHTGFDPNDVSLRTEAAVSGVGHPRIFGHDGPWPRSRTFFGHFVQSSRRPFVTPELICLDTGCGTLPGAPLSGFDIGDESILQFDTSSV